MLDRVNNFLAAFEPWQVAVVSATAATTIQVLAKWIMSMNE
jgi:hypothetical protein